MYNIIGITVGVGIWTTVILFLSLIVSRSWIIFIFILINMAVFIFFGSSHIKQFQCMKNLGSKFISTICLTRSIGLNIL